MRQSSACSAPTIRSAWTPRLRLAYHLRWMAFQASGLSRRHWRWEAARLFDAITDQENDERLPAVEFVDWLSRDLREVP